jgi:hypothetical protein
MIQKPENGPYDRTLDYYLSDQAREMLAEACGLLDVAGSRRATARRLEEQIRAWETRTRVHPLKGTHWELSLKKLIDAITAASRMQRRVYEAEIQAFPLQNACMESLRETLSGPGSHLPREVLRMLASCAKLRSDSLAAIERTLAVSSQIGAFTTRCSTQDVLALLDDRRRSMAESEACRNRADAIEERAFRLETDRLEDMESAAVRALGGEDGLLEPREVNYGSAQAPFGEEEWKTWLRFVEDDFSMGRRPGAAGVEDAGSSAEGSRPDAKDVAAPRVRELANRKALNLAVARLEDAEARLVEATAARDRALAMVARLTNPAELATS